MNIKTENKICVDCSKEFTIDEGDLTLYEKVGSSPSSQCFPCRMKQIFSFWYFGKFRKGVSALSGANLITVLPQDFRSPIYTHEEWYGDKWDAIEYAQDYDPDRSFFDQLKELQEKVPHPHQTGSNNIKCEYCDDAWNSKNCYLSRSMKGCEDLMYSYRNLSVKASVDVTVCFNTEKSYDSYSCSNSYKVFYSRYVRDCIDSYFLYDCRNCQNCFMSWNLRNKQFCIENVEYSKEEYETKLKLYKLGSFNSIKNLKEKYDEIIKNQVINRENYNLKTYNSTGNYLENVKDCVRCNTISDSEDTRNSIRNVKLKSVINTAGCINDELCANCCGCIDSYSLKNSSWSIGRYSEYLDICIDCEYCFGCVGLKKKKYCILNKQYSKEEYETLRERIIVDMKARGEYGKFLPYSMSAGPFNFSTSSLYFPDAKKEDILKLGGYWEDIDESHIEGMPTSELPDDINDVPDDITTKALICPETGWRFNIASSELAFYKSNNIPLPRYHFDVRTKKQLKYLTVLDAYPYKCCYCGKDINAYYLPEWGYSKIACEDCYKQNIA